MTVTVSSLGMIDCHGVQVLYHYACEVERSHDGRLVRETRSGIRGAGDRVLMLSRRSDNPFEDDDVVLLEQVRFRAGCSR